MLAVTLKLLEAGSALSQGAKTCQEVFRADHGISPPPMSDKNLIYHAQMCSTTPVKTIFIMRFWMI